MNYSDAVKGALTRSGAVREIISQSELEFGCRLSPEDEVKLFSKFSPQFILNFLVWFWCSQVPLPSKQQV